MIIRKTLHIGLRNYVDEKRLRQQTFLQYSFSERTITKLDEQMHFGQKFQTPKIAVAGTKSIQATFIVGRRAYTYSYYVIIQQFSESVAMRNSQDRPYVNSNIGFWT